jgi:inhibitor of KinA sporulation pathway (predicted exonuclease)
MILPREFVLFDTEFTADEDSKRYHWSRPGEHREIIQIGAIRVRDLLEIASFMRYVKPQRNPLLSGFIMSLTGITQADVDGGETFPDAYTAFVEFVGEWPAFSWGSDAEVFAENAELTGDPRRLSAQYADMKPLVVPALTARGIDESLYSSGTLHDAFGLPAIGRAHDALNDMRNLLVAVRALS